MTNEIELIDRKRRTFLRVFLMFLVLFVMAWMARFFLSETGSLSKTTSRVTIAILVPAVVGMSYAIFGLNKIRIKTEKDPSLQEALDDELVRHHRTKSWKFAYLAVMACLILFAAFNFFSPIKDFFAVVLTALWAGIVGYLFAFYRMERR